jgi:DNA-binding GntR family transcriptional regulator
MIDYDKAFFDKASSLPLYIQVANWMRSRIITGEWTLGYKLMPEVDQAQKLNISRGTLRQAISLLISEKMIDQVQGKGTFVARAIFEQNWAYKLVSTFEELNWQGIPFETCVLDFAIKEISEERILRKLMIDREKAEIIHLKRLRLVENVPVVIHSTFFPLDPYEKLLDVDFTTYGMTETLEKVFGLDLHYADHAISSIFAEKDIADLLKITVGESIIYDEHVLYERSGQVIEFTKGWFRSDRFRLKTRVFRDGNAMNAAERKGKS